MKKVLVGVTPVKSGVYNFFRIFRTVMAEYGWNVIGISFRPDLWDDELDSTGIIALCNGTWTEKEQARAFLEYCAKETPEIIIPHNNEILLSCIPFVGRDIRVVMRCNSITEHAYHCFTAYREHVSMFVTESPRQADDVKRKYKIDSHSLALIPNAIEVERYYSDRASPAPLLRVGYFGRLEANKGVNFFPYIFQKLICSGVDCEFHIVGEGTADETLRKDIQVHGLREFVTFHGGVTPAQIPQKLWAMDVFVFPTQYEGFGYVTIEAMAAGVVPVVSRIPGVTDFIVEDGSSGFLCDPKNADQFIDKVKLLADNPMLRQKMSSRCTRVARERFDIPRLGQQYHALFERVLESASPLIMTSVAFESHWRPFKRHRPPLYRRFINRTKRLYAVLRSPLVARFRRLHARFTVGKG